MIVDRPEYSLQETIDEFNNWAYHSGRLSTVEASLSALYWLERAPCHSEAMAETIAHLIAWAHDFNPKLPDDLGEDILYWLQRSFSPQEVKFHNLIQ